MNKPTTMAEDLRTLGLLGEDTPLAALSVGDRVEVLVGAARTPVARGEVLAVGVHGKLVKVRLDPGQTVVLDPSDLRRVDVIDALAELA
jgi:hypothetical protein